MTHALPAPQAAEASATPKAPEAPEAPQVHYFGIRHHGPGCARSLVRALDALQPDCVLVEGPPEAEGVLAALMSEHMQPPVALLSYCPDEPGRAVYHPFAVFSPEWQALRWALLRQVPVSFIDLPLAHQLAMAKEREEAEKAAEVEAETGAEAAEAEAVENVETTAKAGDTGKAGNTEKAGNAENAEEGKNTSPVTGAESGESADPAHPVAPAHPTEALDPGDPLHWLAQASGHADGESWWNHTVEERGDGAELFAAIAEAMTTLRADLGAEAQERCPHRARRELLREAFMRQRIRDAVKQGHARIAVVCGAWHLGGLQTATAVAVTTASSKSSKAPKTPKAIKASADAALLKGLPKIKVQTTWVPWTYRHLTRASGYGAGIAAPGWYEHLWLSGVAFDAAPGTAPPRTVGWLARVARLMRERDLDCSSAHLIEATRLADTLAALRQRPQAGLEELHEATRTVLTLGDDAALDFIADALLVGQRMGQVPPDVPTVPLQRDVEQQQKSLRLKPEATQRTLDLDLRQPNDLARSHLLHRLRLIDLPWGRVGHTGSSARGTFHEIWSLQWQPEFVVRLIEASQWGQTLEVAASTASLERAHKAATLGALSQLVQEVLLADLGPAVQAITRILENRAAVSGDTLQLLQALPPLASVFRYGNVRQTDTGMVAHMLDSLTVRAAIGLPLACSGIDDASAEQLRSTLLAAHGAVALRDAPEQTQAWQRALQRVAERGTAHELLQGLATRLLLDDGLWQADGAAQALSLHLSSGADPLKAAAWLEGFLNRNAVVLLHDAQLWQLVNGWLCSLGEAHFTHILPLVRRTFSAFSASERSDLGQRARQGGAATAHAAASASAPPWDAELAALPLPLLHTILGIAPCPT